MTVQAVFSLFTLVLCATFFVYAHLYIRRRTSRESVLAACRDEVDHLIAEIDHATDRDTQLVEERIAALRKILDDADRRIALMSRDMEKRRSATELYTALGTRLPSAPPSQPAPIQARPEIQPAPGGQSSQPGQPGQPAPARPGTQPVRSPPPSGVFTPAAPSAAVQGPPVPLTQRVLELSRQGFSTELIATRLDLSLAEVELALAISRRAGIQTPVDGA
ncbi:MAG: hypothetical protein LBF95_04135 [Treponema sp.]|jgi:hypothetical protein|nr:hypothetical protein [Treponema sp.]